MSSPNAGYYPDPSIPGYIRYWNGSAWVPGTSRPAPPPGEDVAPPPNAWAAAPGPSVAGPPAPRVPALDESGAMFLDEDPSAPVVTRGEPTGEVPASPARPVFPEARGSAGAPAAARYGPSVPSHGGGGAGPSAPGQGDGLLPGGLPAVADQGTPARRQGVPDEPAAGQRAAALGQSPVPGRALQPAPAPPAASPPAPAPAPVPGPVPAAPAVSPPVPPAPMVPVPAASPALPAAPAAFAASAPVLPAASAPVVPAASAPLVPATPASAAPVAPPTASAPPAPVAPAAAAPAPAAASGPPAPVVPVESAPPAPVLPAAPAVGGGVPWQRQVHELAQPLGQAPGQPPGVFPGAPGNAPPGPFPGGPGTAQPPQGQAAPQRPLPWKPVVADPFAAAASQARPAGLAPRLAARLVDSVIVGAVVAVAAVPLGSAAYDHIREKMRAARLTGETVTVWLIDGTTSVQLGLIAALLFVTGLLYEALPTGKWGRTLGKKLLKLKVLDIETQYEPGFGRSVRRWLARTVLSFLGVGVLGVAWCLFDRPWRQGWHDKLARTFVARDA